MVFRFKTCGKSFVVLEWTLEQQGILAEEFLSLNQRSLAAILKKLCNPSTSKVCNLNFKCFLAYFIVSVFLEAFRRNAKHSMIFGRG